MSVLVLAAAREELGDLEGEVVGVGPIVSGIRTAALLEARRPERVVLIGSAGTYEGRVPIGAAVASGRLGISWGVAALGLGYVPRPPESLLGDPEMLELLQLPARDVLTVGAITTDAGLAARLGDGWAVEHMESFAVAYACHNVGVPFVAVLGITNDVGPDAHVQWLAHRAAAHRAAQQAILPLLTA